MKALSPIRLIAVTLDDALLDAEHRFHDGDIRELAEAHQRGAMVVIATHRPFQSAKPHVRSLGFPCPVIALDGARTVENDDSVSDDRPLTPRDTKHALHLARAFEVTTMVSVGDEIIVGARIEDTSRIERNDVVAHVVIGDLRNVTDAHGPAHNVRFIGAHKTLIALKANLIATLDGRGALHFIDDNTLCLTASSASKGSALAALMRKHGVKRREVIAIGASDRDRSMLSVAGISVVTETAPPQMKSRADIVIGRAGSGAIGAIVEDLQIAARDHNT